MPASDLLIADLEHFGESMWRNEEVGEKRFNFFVTLVTAVAAGLVALATADGAADAGAFREVAGAASAALLVLGLVSYLRMLHRNRITDEYKKTLGYIRRRYVEIHGDPVPYDVPRRTKSWAGTWLKGGYAETMGTMDGMLLTAFLVLGLGAPLGWGIAAGAALAALLWIHACRRAS